MKHRINVNKKETPSMIRSILDGLHWLLSVIVTIYMVLILGVLPFYNSEGYTEIGTDKAALFAWAGVNLAKITIPLLLCMLVLSLVEYCRQGGRQERRLHFSITDVFAGLYGVSLLLSYAASDYKSSALWGASGWYMGLYTQLLLLASYFLISRFWDRKKWIVYVMLAASGVVFLLGYLNRFGIYPIDMKMILPSFLSTIGNINWYCGYLVSVFFGGVFLLWRGMGRRRDAFLMIYTAIGFATLVTQGSSSGILTLVVMLLLFFYLSAPDAGQMQNFWKLVLLLGIVCVGTFALRMAFPEQITFVETTADIFTYSALPIFVTAVSILFYGPCSWSRKKGCYPQKTAMVLAKIVCISAVCAAVLFAALIMINTLWPGSIGGLSKLSIFTFDPAWGSNRGATWEAAVMCFSQQDFLHKLVGIGPDCMPAFLYQDGSEELLALVRESFGEATLTNAHNEWLTILVNTGVLGAVSYVGMVVSGIVRYVKKRNVSEITAMAGFCLLAYTVNNLFSFQQAMNVSTIFVIWGMGEAYASHQNMKKTANP